MNANDVVEAVVIEPAMEAEVVEQSQRTLGNDETCDACGSPISVSDKFCGACGTAHESPGQAEAGKMQHLRCETCSAEIATDTKSRSYTCPFCDSTYVVEFTPEQTDRMRPEFVIGFSVTRKQALETFRKWLHQNQWFRPKDLSTSAIEDKQRGVYLPFWTFSARVHSQWRANIGEHYYETETYWTTENGKQVQKTRQVQRTEWWPLSGKHHHYYAGYLISASRGLPQAEAQQIQPFNLSVISRYEPHFLAGWLSEEYSIEQTDAWEVCKGHFFQLEQSKIAGHMPGDTHRSLEVQSNFEHTGTDLILLPVHILSYRYQEKVYRFLVNGQTGKFSGEKPVSGKKIAVAVVVGIIVVALIMLLIAMGERRTMIAERCQTCRAMTDIEDLFCHNCGTECPHPQQHESKSPDATKVTHSFQCGGCGASMSYDASAGALRCPFCGAEDLREQERPHKVVRANVVPMGIDRATAQKKLQDYLGSGFWHPGDLGSASQLQQATPVYVPYWVYSATVHTNFTADSSQTPFGASGDWFPVAGQHQGHHSGVLVSASSVLTPAETQTLLPFDLTKNVDPESVDLENITVEEFRVQRKAARGVARAAFENLERQQCSALVPGRNRNLSVNVMLEDMSSVPMLLPVWILAYRYRDELFRVLINGQTGELSGTAPTSMLKLAAVIGGIVLLIIAIIALIAASDG